MAASGDTLIATATAASKNQTTGSTTSVGTYVTSLTTAGTCGVAFVAPPTGKVTVLFHTAGFGSGTGDMKTAIRIGTGSTVGGGTQYYAATDEDMILFTGTAVYGIGSFMEVTGLTAGDTYNACMAHNTSAGTASFLRRSIKVIPDL
jgi:hypothetical protein